MKTGNITNQNIEENSIFSAYVIRSSPTNKILKTFMNHIIRITLP